MVFPKSRRVSQLFPFVSATTDAEWDELFAFRKKIANQGLDLFPVYPTQDIVRRYKAGPASGVSGSRLPSPVVLTATRVTRCLRKRTFACAAILVAMGQFLT